METTFQTRLTQKTDTSTNWSNNNPVLLNGEIAFEVTNSNVRMKVGDGESTYDSLPVIATTEIASIADVNGLQSALDGKLGTTAQAADSAKLNGQLPAYYLNYNNLSNKPAIPSVGNGTITIKQAGTTKGTFTTNQSGNTTIELTDSNTTYSSKSAASGGTDVSLVTTGEKYTWNNKASTSVATQSAAGLMSASDKAKLDGIASGANNYTYTLPSAGTSLGGVKSGGDVTISSGVITVNDDSHNHTIANVDGLQDELDAKAKKEHGIYYIEGTSTTAGTWIGTCNDITEYYDGLTVAYKVNKAGASTTTLNINGLGAKTVYLRGTTKLTTQYTENTVIIAVYTTVSGTGRWYVNDYDANTNTYQRLYPTTSNVEYPITTRYNTTTGETYYAEYGRYSTGVTLNPSTNTITATAFKGSLTGNADTATKAVSDGNGNNIVNTYATKTELTTRISELEAQLSALEARMNALNLGFVESEDDM